MDSLSKRKNSSVKRKRFSTSYTKSDGKFAWSILAKDWSEAKRICNAIGHKLEGLMATQNQINSALASLSH